MIDEPELIRLVYKKYSLECKSPKEIVEDLKSRGIEITEYKINQILKRTNEILTEYDKIEIKKYLLDSIDEVKEDFEKIRKELWDIIEKSKEEERGDFKRLAAIRELKSFLELALKRLGELKSDVTIKADNVNIEKMNVVVTQIRERIWEENKATDKDGMIVLNPKPEVMDDYQKWKRRKKQVEINENL